MTTEKINEKIMTIVRNYKEYIIDGETYFVEMYKEKYWKVWMWRYGYVTKEYSMIISDCLASRPNLKRLFGS